MADVLADIVARRRDRAIAAVLGVKEREVDPLVPDQVARRLRKVVLDQFNDYTSLVMDVLTSLTEGQADGSTVILNEHWLVKIAEIHDAVTGTGA